MQNDVRTQLLKDMIRLYKDTTEIYYATRYLEMLLEPNANAYEIAIALVNNDDKLGFTKLHEANRLDLSLEVLLIKKYQDFFPANVIDKCKKRLTKYGYIIDPIVK